MKYFCIFLLLLNSFWCPLKAKQNQLELYVQNELFVEDKQYSQKAMFEIVTNPLNNISLYCNGHLCEYTQSNQGISFYLQGLVKPENIIELSGFDGSNVITQSWKLRLYEDDQKPIVKEIKVGEANLMEADVITSESSIIRVLVEDDSICSVKAMWNQLSLECVKGEKNEYEFILPQISGSDNLTLEISDQWGNECVYQSKGQLISDQEPPVLVEAFLNNQDLLETANCYLNGDALLKLKVVDALSGVQKVEVIFQNEVYVAYDNDGYYHVQLEPKDEMASSLKIIMIDNALQVNTFEIAQEVIVDLSKPKLKIRGLDTQENQVCYINEIKKIQFQMSDLHMELPHTQVSFTKPIDLQWQMNHGQYESEWILDPYSYQDGSYQLCFSSIDKANNKTSIIQDVVIDKTVPKGAFINPKAMYHQPTTLYFQLNDKYLNVNATHIEIYHNDVRIEEKINDCKTPYGYRYDFKIGRGMLQADGIYRICVQGQDYAGNKSMLYEHCFVYDTNQPQVKTILWNDIDVTKCQTPLYDHQKAEVKIVFEDDLSGIAKSRLKIKLKSSQDPLNYIWENDSVRFVVPLNSIDEHFVITGYDKAGNTFSYQSKFKFTIENKKALITANVHNQYLNIQQPFTFHFKIDDTSFDARLMNCTLLYDGIVLSPNKWNQYGFVVEYHDNEMYFMLDKEKQASLHTYEFIISGKDLCGNPYQKSFYYVDDTIVPKLSYQWMNPYVQDVQNIVFQDQAKIKITLEDQYLDIASSKIKVYYQHQEIPMKKHWAKDDDCYEMELSFDKEGYYELYVEAKDFSQNVIQQKIETFIIDHSNPQVSITYDRNMIDNEQIITWNWQDHLSTSMLYITFDGVDAKHQTLYGSKRWYGIETKEDLHQLPFIDVIQWSNHQLIVKLNDDFKGTFHYYVKDIVNHQSKIHHTPRMIVETSKDVDDKLLINYHIKENQAGVIKGIDAYTNNIQLQYQIKAPFSGIARIELQGVVNKVYSLKDLQTITKKSDKYIDEVVLLEQLVVLQDGIQSQDIIVYDCAGISKKVTYQFIMDSQKPQVILSSSHQGYVNKDVMLSIDVIDDHFHAKNLDYRCLRNGEDEIVSWIWNGQKAYARLSKEGNYQIAVCVKDEVNQDSGWKSLPAFTIDKSKPMIQIDNQLSTYTNQSQTFTLCIYEQHFDEKLVKLELSDNFQTTQWNHDGDMHYLTLSTIQDGSYHLNVDVIDQANNKCEKPFIVDFIVDRKAPELTLHGIQPFQSYDHALQPYLYISEDYLQNCIVTLTSKNHSSQTFIPTIKDKQKLFYDLSLLNEDDLYQLYIDAKDHAGNHLDYHCVFTINQKGSTFTLLNQLVSQKYLTQKEKLRIQIDNLDIVNIVGFRINGKVKPYTFQNGILETIEPLSQGLQVIQLTTIDNAQNYNEMKPISIVCDDTLPSAQVLINQQQEVDYCWNQATIDITTQADDEISAIYINKEKVAIKDKQKVQITLDQSGIYQIEVHLKDALGHTNVLPVKTFQIISIYDILGKIFTVLGVIMILCMMMYFSKYFIKINHKQ